MIEKWASYPNQPEYEVSNYGRVRKGNRLISSFVHRDGYVMVGMAVPGKKRRDPGGRRQKFVHQLVLETFVGPRPKGLIALHDDDNKENNHVSNLSWGTYSKNQLDALKNGKHRYKKHPFCKYGHKLEDPNLRVSKGHRQCKACAQATSTICGRKAKRGIDDSHLMEQIANERYERIMKNVGI